MARRLQCDERVTAPARRTTDTGSAIPVQSGEARAAQLALVPPVRKPTLLSVVLRRSLDVPKIALIVFLLSVALLVALVLATQAGAVVEVGPPDQDGPAVAAPVAPEPAAPACTAHER
jgi:hypothetical protein